jgi:hypothetical protein
MLSYHIGSLGLNRLTNIKTELSISLVIYDEECCESTLFYSPSSFFPIVSTRLILI